MAYYFPEGSKFYFSKTFAAAKTISAITNANPAVATSTSHGYVNGDEILLTQSAVVLEQLIGQFMFGNGESGEKSGSTPSASE